MVSTVTDKVLAALAALAVFGCSGAPDRAPAASVSQVGDAGAAAHSSGDGDHGMPHSFGDAERWARVFDDPNRDSWQKPGEVIALMEIEPGMCIADIGAGTGYFLPHLSRAVGNEGRVLALDIEPELVTHMRKRSAKEGLAAVEARVVEPDDPGLDEGSVDRVIIVDTWHHLPDRTSYVRKLAAALAPAGSVFVVDFTLATERGPSAHHRVPPETAAAELEAAGLEASILEETLPDQYVVRGSKP